MSFEREPNQFAVTIPADAPTGGTVIDYRKYSGGVILITSGASLAALTFYVAAFGVAAADHKLFTSIEAIDCDLDQAVEIPPELFAAHSIVIVGDEAGGATVFLKS